MKNLERIPLLGPWLALLLILIYKFIIWSELEDEIYRGALVLVVAQILVEIYL